jgi:manganese transport protein
MPAAPLGTAARTDAQTVEVPADLGTLRTFLRVLGPGSQFGYRLLWVIGLSSLMAMVLQSLCCRLGIATRLDLAQACSQLLPRFWRIPLWLLAEVAIIACDLAELVGSAIALQLLFGLPLLWGVGANGGRHLAASSSAALRDPPAGGIGDRPGGSGGRLLRG